ncbi:hypothetical protein D9756_004289 [Leucocoprinus leucothites]|uniref:Uncharacterized protein n=1 Tax=Leucocoprinus leucothites TaxID=201217 RepID=A0A8H5DA72_9AGAR|nr:hypothetical protein D9756_004289 [Leucoagaricus leucothites]
MGSVQVVSAAHLYHGGRQVSHAKQASGQASSTDAELYSIHIGIAKAISLQCNKIILITDSKPSQSINFWDIPSKWHWKPHLKVHNDVTTTHIYAPPHTDATLDFL